MHKGTRARPAVHARESAHGRSEKEESSAQRRMDGASAPKSKRRSLGQIKGRRPEAERERKRASWAEAEEAAKRRKRKRCESFDETVMPFVAGL